jgi:hypothetical protein
MAFIPGDINIIPQFYIISAYSMELVGPVVLLYSFFGLLPCEP